MSLNLDELAAINDELAALVRAGVPLEPGLARLGSEMPGRLGRRARALAERLQGGEALEDVLDDPRMGVPRMYTAILRAGQRSGRLAPALELFAETLTHVRDTRRAVIGACIYPLIVIFMALLLGMFTVRKILPSFHKGTLDFDGTPPSESMMWLPWGVAATVLVLVTFLWWARSWRANLLVPGDVGNAFAWLPWMRSVARWSRQAILVDLLRLFVGQGVPLPEALRSAAQATGDRRTIQAMASLAERLEAGDLTALGRLDARSKSHGLSSLLRWLFVAARREDRLLPALGAASERYHQRVILAARRAQVLLPVLITLVAGGFVVSMYVWLVFAPYLSFLRILTLPVGG